MRFHLPLLTLLTLPLASLAAAPAKPSAPASSSSAAAKPPKKKAKAKPEADRNAPKLERAWAPYVEPSFPFISSVLDARELGAGWPADNLTPRGIVVNVGQGIHACFDTDLLRVALVWQGDAKGDFITLNAMAPGSYLNPGQKTAEGQDNVPKPIGTPWLANGIYPGWSTGSEPSFSDPREPAPSKEEVGRGGLVGETQFLSLRHDDTSVTFRYRVSGTIIEERWSAESGKNSAPALRREFTVRAHRQPLTLLLGHAPAVGESQSPSASLQADKALTLSQTKSGCWYATLSATDESSSFVINVKSNAPASSTAKDSAPASKPTAWSEVVTTTAKLSPDQASAYVLDDIGLPLDNPWKRSMRVADLAFLDDQGHAAAVTFDGDVWLISGLKGDLKQVEWKRFASGLHEPMSMVAKITTLSATERAELSNELMNLEKSWQADKRASIQQAISQTPTHQSGGLQIKDDGTLAETLNQQKAALRKLTQAGADKAAITAAEKAVQATELRIEAAEGVRGHTMEEAKARELTLDGGAFVAYRKAQNVITKRLKEELSIHLYVFDRNGIWRLRDDDGDGVAETHEMFCNRFAQTAETREFASSMKRGPDGSLYLSKGGQQGTHLGKDNGSVLRISPDGQSVETIAYGLRQPFIGVHPTTGLVTASDQQGNYVPSTPLHLIGGHRYYGFLTQQVPKLAYPEAIADPLTWIPHPVNPSGFTQVWLVDSKMGPLNDSLVHIAYSRPEIFRVMADKRHGDWTQWQQVQPSKTKPQAAVCTISITLPAGMKKTALPVLPFAPLNGHVNPADGMLYLVGFQIWGSIAERTAGLARVRYTGGESTLPSDVAAMDKGVLVRFDCAVDKATASNPDNYNVERWNYKRTHDYGSPHFKLDGSTGQELQTVSHAYVSEDGRSVFLSLPDMRVCDQVHVGWSIKSAAGQTMAHNAYLTPWQLAAFDSAKEGFGSLVPDVTPRKVAAIAAVKASVEEGQRLYQFIGCMGCHSVDGSVAGRLGPSWKGLYGSKRELADGSKVTADEAYLRESILDPSKKMVKAYLKLETGMPIYAGILSETQIESVILYMKSLK